MSTQAALRRKPRNCYSLNVKIGGTGRDSVPPMLIKLKTVITETNGSVPVRIRRANQAIGLGSRVGLPG